MPSWTEYELSDVVNLKSGTTVKKEFERESGDVAYIKVSGMNLEGNEFKIRTANTFLNLENINVNNVLPIGTTIFPKRGGAIATNKKRITDIPLCIDLNTMGVIPRKELVLPLYIYYYFKSFDLLSISNGTTIPQINNYSFNGLKIFVPPIPEQECIVAILDQAFADIEKARANAEQNLKNARELFDHYLLSLFKYPDESWLKTKIGNLCTKMEYGSSAKSHDEGEIPVLRMGNIQNGAIDWSNLKYSVDREEIEKYNLQKNDVLFNRTNSDVHVGKTAIYKGDAPAIFAGYLIRVHRKQELIDGDFLNFYLNSSIARDYGKTIMSRSVNQANINASKLKEYPIAVPDLKTQELLVANMVQLNSKVEELKGVYRRKLDLLEMLKKSILQKAFSGQLTKSKGIAA